MKNYPSIGNKLKIWWSHVDLIISVLNISHQKLLKYTDGLEAHKVLAASF